MILSDFICPIHGRFEVLADRDAESAPCPVPYECDKCSATPDRHGDYEHGPRCDGTAPRLLCGLASPWAPTAPAVHTAFVVTATRGKSDPPPSALATNTRPLMEGQRYSEWRKERKKLWRDYDHKQRKERG